MARIKRIFTKKELAQLQIRKTLRGVQGHRGVSTKRSAGALTKYIKKGSRASAKMAQEVKMNAGYNLSTKLSDPGTIPFDPVSPTYKGRQGTIKNNNAIRNLTKKLKEAKKVKAAGAVKSASESVKKASVGGGRFKKFIKGLGGTQNVMAAAGLGLAINDAMSGVTNQVGEGMAYRAQAGMAQERMGNISPDQYYLQAMGDYRNQQAGMAQQMLMSELTGGVSGQQRPVYGERYI